MGEFSGDGYHGGLGLTCFFPSVKKRFRQFFATEIVRLFGPNISTQWHLAVE